MGGEDDSRLFGPQTLEHRRSAKGSIALQSPMKPEDEESPV